jgi:hypothetical protein
MKYSQIATLALCLLGVGLLGTQPPNPVEASASAKTCGCDKTCKCSQEDIAALTSRVFALEAAVKELQTVEPPAEPEPEPEAKPVVEIKIKEPVAKTAVAPVRNDFIQYILDTYRGNEWYHNGQRVGKAHLVEHGFSLDDLNGRSGKELGMLHGAVHTNSLEGLRKAYNGTATMKYSKSVSQPTTRTTRGYWRKVCRGGQCFREWVSY